MLTKDTLRSLGEMKHGDRQEIRLPCESFIEIERDESGFPAFNITVRDSHCWVQSSEDFDADLTNDELDGHYARMIILDKSLPVLRALLCGLSHKPYVPSDSNSSNNSSDPGGF